MEAQSNNIEITISIHNILVTSNGVIGTIVIGWFIPLQKVNVFNEKSLNFLFFSRKGALWMIVSFQ